MDNPFLKSAKLLLIYISMWMLITLAHFSVIYFFYSFELNVVITDSLLFNLTYALLGLSIWYVVNYNEPLKSINFNTFLNLLTFATILLFVWIYTCNGLLHIFFSDNADYLNFLNRSLSWRVLTGIFLNVILTLIYYVIIYYSDMQERSLREAKLKEMIRISELNILKSQINPHFLFNSLNSISSFTITNPDKAREMIIKLSNFLRYSISQSEIKLTTLGSELENMRRYLDIEQVRFGNRLNQIFEIDPHCNEKEIPTMILQPIYENAVKHGVYESSEPIMIKTICKFENEMLHLFIINNFDTESRSIKGAGMELKNIRERLKLTYGSEDFFKTKIEGNTFFAELFIPQKIL